MQPSSDISYGVTMFSFSSLSTLGRRTAILALTASAMTLSSINSYADISAKGDDGRTILLKQNGQWEFSNNDRFATTADGTRVKLKDDGSWEFIGNAPIQSKQQFRAESLDVKLSKVETKYTQEKAGSKNVRTKAHTLFYFDVDISNYATSPVIVNLKEFNGLSVTDSRDHDYKIIAATGSAEKLQPGNNYRFEVRVDGAPKFTTSFLSVKNITLTIDKSVFLTAADIKLTAETDDIIVTKVDNL